MLAVWTFVAAAQTPKFDVASVKAIPPPVGSYRADFGTATHGQLTFTNVTFSECVRYAFGITNDYQIAGSDWIKSRQYLFDITGKAPADTQIVVPSSTVITRAGLERFRAFVQAGGKLIFVGKTPGLIVDQTFLHAKDVPDLSFATWIEPSGDITPRVLAALP